MKYKAVFFDRDGTLTYFNPEKKAWRDKTISQWSGKPFEIPYDKMMKLFELAAEGKNPWYSNLEDEQEFFKRYYRVLLVGEGVTRDIDRRADLLFSELWCNGDRLLFPETIEVLEYFQGRGYKMGVISDTSPSLEYTLQQLGIAKYFTSFTASSLVGAYKPSPVIFNAALSAQGVTASESLYVDDYKPEADGAREQGFTSFLLDRRGGDKDEWTISSLRELVEFAEVKCRVNNVHLHIPSENELDYRRQLISDEATMSYNTGYGDNGGCTYIQTPEQVRQWYQDWNKNYNNYYAYIVRSQNNKFIGEVNLHKSRKEPWYEMGIVLEAKYRGMGYSVPALKLLLGQAFETMHAEAVHNDFEETREAAIKAHLKAGFIEIRRENGIIELLITKEQYYSEE